MPDIKYQEFSVTGVASSTVLDTTGLTSTQEEPKRLVALLVNVSGYADNVLEGWLEREKVVSVYDKVLATDANSGGTNTILSTTKILRLPVEKDIPVGQTFKVGLRCGATNKNLHGAYEYEITG